jgi:hypothetical protein
MQQNGLHARQYMRVRPSENMASRFIGMDSQYKRCSSGGKARKKHAGQAEGLQYQMCSHASHQALTKGYCYSVIKPRMTSCRPYKIAEAAKCSTKCCPPSPLVGLPRLLVGGARRLAWSVQQHPQ